MFDILHEIVRLLPHRQEVLDDLHDRINEAAQLAASEPAAAAGSDPSTGPATEAAPPA